ncbi:hypothetical protein EYC84_008514 [Monilinia fructicola]|uniref:Alkyl hydroperoxide reductase subunit C/ Thiol specific antioxidant domain-containing protein n=1 Tax=Monilinia fructicola TaxID=38448 RepID=A0A5M9JFL9_MONFR|nr:hypothetical protein EYC84_008514 [Monilinia fructicola]
MFSKFTTKLALRKAGLPSNALSTFSITNLDNGDQKSINPNSSKLNEPPATWADTFSNMTAEVNVPKSWKSWGNPPPAIVEVAPAPVVGTKAPSTVRLMLPMGDGKACVLLFLRCCGCAFAEKSFIELRRLANKHQNLHFIAISHNSKEATDRWVQQVGGHEVARQKLGKQEGIWGREVDPSGNRWVVGGSWATDEMGTIKWGAASKSADEIPDLVEACKSVGVATVA